MLLTIVVVLLAAAFLFVKRHYSYWETVEIPNMAKSPFGNLCTIGCEEKTD